MGLAKKLCKTALVIGGTLGAMTLFNKMTRTMAGELDTTLTGEERRYAWKYGDMFYMVKGAPTARPLLFIHSLGPGSSSYEWRHNIDALSDQFRVYSLDLLGFGLSDHPAIDYTPEMYADLLHDFIKEVIGQPAIVVAHGLPSAYIIGCAFRRPQLFERLVLVAPPATILQERFPEPLNSAWRLVLSLPIVGEFLYNVLTLRQSIRGYYDRQGYHNLLLLTDELVEYIYTSAHQPNSHYPMAAYLSGDLTMDVQEPLARLKMPVIAVWGRESSFAPSEAAIKRVNPNVEVRILDKCKFHLQEEQAEAFNNLLREFASIQVP
ncbi:MAG: alpha/beta fold hydrolase [Ktedonobacteraceae bacterium]|nr:alpha/beta fold hydrolase [Ktedonobacteraceae bacterium]